MCPLRSNLKKKNNDILSAVFDGGRFDPTLAREVFDIAPANPSAPLRAGYGAPGFFSFLLRVIFSAQIQTETLPV